ncbi:MAG: hypothetical protein DK304_001179 [Chloroflexi bacterium]|jgi:hypothetical protein|nr:MAG: hypothetical protein DK304_001179 [Chloroflexota bacterium]
MPFILRWLNYYKAIKQGTIIESEAVVVRKVFGWITASDLLCQFCTNGETHWVTKGDILVIRGLQG